MNDIIPILKYAGVVVIFIAIVLTPAYLAAANESKPYDSMRVRCGSWLFGWSFIGWFFALFVSAKK